MKTETFAFPWSFPPSPHSPYDSFHLSAMINQFSFANPRASFDCSDYEQGEDEHKDDSSTPSPLLWKNMNFPSSRLASSSPRAQEIVSYRQEMMDLMRGMPESAYELSLRDLVETPRIVKKVEEAAETRQEGAKNKAEKATDRSKGGLFLKTSVPVLDGGKTKSSRSNSFAKFLRNQPQSMPPPPEEEGGAARRCCVWLVSCCFLMVLLAGGVLLALYIVLPESPDTASFPVAGVVLVAIPWLFWLVTCTYRCTKACDVERPLVRAATVAPASGNKVTIAGGDDSSLNSRESEAPLAYN
ncbi:hypothetical protein ZIOFF_063434 [Zingiber officinale]|uniref:Uncharacterized protein n=1 Tax=Zingiber officinale TaxID=94328 RepID=A0A8J5F6G3_ZINOF|nr:hypothetical protein ZIOFF_063434 [Zingiber officinale]